MKSRRKQKGIKLNKKQTRFLKIFLIVVILLIFSIIIFELNHNKIDSFEECAKAGNPVMESYPRQCIANGNTFVEEIKDIKPY